MTTTEFRKQLCKVHEPRQHKLTGSYGCKDYYLYYRKKYSSKITQGKFVQIFRAIMLDLIDKYLLTRLNLNFPNNMGSITVDDVKQKVIKQDKHYHVKAPIDWVKTIELWEHDEESRQRKLKIYSKHTNTACLHFYKNRKGFKGQKYFYLQFSRSLKKYIYHKLVLNENFNLNG